ncbi:MAG TPA: GNAT family N-acetyltransferase [Sphingobium sp.]|nr:GNAT family N-acetyltransferase [Sphingobium sp.]
MSIALPDGYHLREGADAVAAHGYLSRSYWATGIPLETVRQSLENSFAISVLHGTGQVSMARVITDYTTFAYLADVYVLEAHRGLGLSKAMVAFLRAHPRLQNLRRWALCTLDAQPLYRQFGWVEYPHPERMMTLDNPDIYG